jgi:hypothetical protein
MDLPVLPDAEALQRAIEAEDLLKASPDDPKHPGYPKGAPDGRGGQFRPKGALVGEEAERAVEQRLIRQIARRAFRAGLRRILTWRAVLRFGGELASNVDPIGPAEVGDAMMVEQAVEVLAELAGNDKEAKAAIEFVKHGPWDLEDLLVDKTPRSFNTFDALKKTEHDPDDLEKFYGEAGDGFEYHHLAEQGANGRALPPQELNSSRNVIRIPKLVHEEVTAEFVKTRDVSGGRQSLRAALSGRDFETHREAGIQLLREMGIIK